MGRLAAKSPDPASGIAIAGIDVLRFVAGNLRDVYAAHADRGVAAVGNRSHELGHPEGDVFVVW